MPVICQMPAVAATRVLTERHLCQWKTLFEHLTGLQLAGQREPLVRAVLERRIGETGCASGDDYLYRLQNSPAFSAPEWELLIGEVVIGETRFFRYESAFAFIANAVAGKVRSRADSGRITAWSAGCSSGEEAYSLAMVLQRICSGASSPLPFSVIGTDINGRSLKQASRATYRNVLERGMDETGAATFFDFLGNDSYRIKESLRKRVNFLRHNLLEPVASALIPPMDLISCQNVLMYLQPWRRRAVVRHLASLLKEDGVLVLCPGDLRDWKPANLERVAARGVQAYRRVY